MELTLPSVAEELLREIKRNFQETSQISDEHLLGLKFIFGPTALHALDLVDQRSVTHVTSPSGRSTFQCKHILAVYLSQAVRCCQDLSVSDKQMSEILLAKED
ncbi:hypothetical protein GDO81_006803 [Engystomops pustulosus]|uniref:Zinc finger SWIM domain-containing protein 7 n=1 Tax=Engystomops pustulosus TaxID=76066 RepID=A0AAV7CZI5_ENGPU|nr:hypothetical protein GDO81_006803 [Engystomops pustulosus]